MQRALGASYLLDARYIGNKGTRLPRMIEANPAVYGPGATSGNADQRRIYAGCHGPQGPCDFGSVGLITNSDELDVSRGAVRPVPALQPRALVPGFLHVLEDRSIMFRASMWRVRRRDWSAARTTWRRIRSTSSAEHGPSLFDARHRFIFSGSCEIPFRGPRKGLRAWLLGGWQLNTIANFASGTPFTVYDSANVALQGSAPEITGFYSSRPDADRRSQRRLAHAGSVDEPLRIPPSGPGDAGRASSAATGRNTVRGPGIANVDLSLLKTFAVTERARLQFRAECFNIANHANFGLPENDIASPNFGRVLTAGSPRLFQFALK